MRALPSIIVGVVIFAIWLSVVGNPHVVETVIGLVLGIAGAIYFHLQLLPKIWPKQQWSLIGGLSPATLFTLEW